MQRQKILLLAHPCISRIEVYDSNKYPLRSIVYFELSLPKGPEFALLYRTIHWLIEYKYNP